MDNFDMMADSLNRRQYKGTLTATLIAKAIRKAIIKELEWAASVADSAAQEAFQTAYCERKDAGELTKASLKARDVIRARAKYLKEAK